MKKSNMTLDINSSPRKSLSFRSLSCKAPDIPFRFVPTLKPITLFETPSPMCLVPLYDFPVIEKINLNERHRCYSDDEQSKGKKSKLIKESSYNLAAYKTCSGFLKKKKSISNLELLQTYLNENYKEKEKEKVSPFTKAVKVFDDDEYDNLVYKAKANEEVENESLPKRTSILLHMENRRSSSINEIENVLKL